jgi:hypothetical protein
VSYPGRVNFLRRGSASASDQPTDDGGAGAEGEARETVVVGERNRTAGKGRPTPSRRLPCAARRTTAARPPPSAASA